MLVNASLVRLRQYTEMGVTALELGSWKDDAVAACDRCLVAMAVDMKMMQQTLMRRSM